MANRNFQFSLGGLSSFLSKVAYLIKDFAEKKNCFISIIVSELFSGAYPFPIWGNIFPGNYSITLIDVRLIGTERSNKNKEWRLDTKYK